MKIVVFGHKRIPSREGGVEVVVEELSTRMAKLGNEVTCINRKGHHVSGIEFDAKKMEEYKGVKLLTVPTIDKKGFAAASSSFFAAIKVAIGRYDIVHIHAEGSAVFCWIPKLFGKKVVVSCHGIDWERPRWKGTMAENYIKLGEKMMVKYADEIIVLSKSVQNYFQETYGRKTSYIPNGVNRLKKRAANQIQKKWGLKNKSFILSLARLTEEKKIHLLIEAYKTINTDLKLVIAGGSSDSDEYVEKLIKIAGNSSKIIFTGFVQGKVLEELYSNAYIYCLPSELEGMPLSLLEAMSYGNCCLVSNIPECTEVIRNQGISFKKNDVKDLKEKLQILISNPKIVDEYRLKAADYICEKYNWDDVVEKTLALYMKTGRKKKNG